MVKRNFHLSPTENAAIAVIITNAIVEELGVKASIRRVRFVPASQRYVVRRLSAIEIARRAQQRAADRFAREMEGVYH